MPTRPLLAAKLGKKQKFEDLEKYIKFPCYVSPKIDGIRCLVQGKKILTRSFKSQPNIFITKYLQKYAPAGCDGELIIRGKKFNESQSGIMSIEGEPDFIYWVFDLCKKGEERFTFGKRFGLLTILNPMDYPHHRIKILPHYVIGNMKQLLSFEKGFLKQGYEGIMIRSMDGIYKSGQSTLKEGYLIKYKRFKHSEAKIIGYVEQEHNTNPQTTNELGTKSRSTKRKGRKLAHTLGAFIVQDLKTKKKFNIGSGNGLTHRLRREVWENQKSYSGKIIRYKFMKYGMKNLPRQPQFDGFRSKLDL